MTAAAGAGSLVALFKIDSSGAQASMTSAEVTVSQALEKMKRQFIAVSARVKELEGGTKAFNNGASMAKATQEIVKYGQAAELTAKQQARAMQMLPAQISDIGVSLASGQQPWLVMIQQGAQIKDMFGGLGGAARALLSTITPLSVTLTAVASAVGVLGYAIYDSYERTKNFANGLQLTNNAAGLTAASFEDTAVRVRAATNVTIGASRDIVHALSNTGRFGPGEVEKVAVALLNLSRVSGESAEKMVADFASIKDGVVKWAVEQNKQLNFLTPAIYAAAKAAEDAGDKHKAMSIVLDALNPRLEKNASLWERVKNAATFALPDFSSLFGGKEESDALAAVQERIAKNRGLQFRSDYDDKVLGKLLDQEKLLKQARDTRDSRAAESAKAAQVNASGVAARQAIDNVLQETKSRERLNKEVERYQRLFKEAEAAGSPYSKAEQEAVLNALRAKFAGPKPKAPNDALHNEYAAYGRDRMESDDAAWEARRRAEEQAAKDQWSIDKQNAVQLFRDDAERMAKEAAEAKKQMEKLAKDGEDQVQVFEDRIMLLVRNGKDGFKDLFNSMAEEFIRNMIRMAAQKMLLDKSGAFVGWGQGAQNAWGAVSGFFGGGGAASGAPINWDIGFAGGLDYVPYDGFRATLHKGERVQRSVEANADRARESGGRPVQHIDNSIVIQGDASRATVRAMRAGQNMQTARMANAERY